MTSNEPIKLLLVDDHAVVRAGFKLLLTAAVKPIIAEAERGEQALQVYSQLQPDIVIMDLSMPGIGGLETIRRLTQRDADAKILVFSVHDQPVYIHRALNAGAKAYISKTSAPELLLDAIATLLEDRMYIEKGLLPEHPKQPTGQDFQEITQTLSTREFDIFKLLAQGLTLHKIAGELCLSYKTVANYTTQIKKKLRVSSVAEITRIAVASGIIKY